MSDAVAITNLLYRYGELVDAGDFEGLGRLLAHAVVRDDSGALELRGAEAVTRLYEHTTRRYPDTGTPKTKHLISNPIVEIDAGARTAKSRSQYVVLQQTETLALQPIVTGRYRHTFERADDGWRIASHTFVVDQVGDVSQHLLIELDAEHQAGALRRRR